MSLAKKIIEECDRIFEDNTPASDAGMDIPDNANNQGDETNNEIETAFQKASQEIEDIMA